MILDAGFLVSVDRGEPGARAFLTAAQRSQVALHTTHPVVAQVWRDGAIQARLTRFLGSVTVHPFDDGPTVGHLLAAAATSDVVDAHLVTLALRLDDAILTGDTADLERLAGAIPTRRPEIHAWP